MGSDAGSRPLRVLISGGGTGGHLFPALALARELARRDPRTRILFAGTRYGLETRVVPAAGFPLRALRVRGLRGKGAAATLAALALLPVGLVEALMTVLGFRPDGLVGVGGYASFPVSLAGRLLGRPLLVQEQNVEPGLSNRLLGRLAWRVAVAHAETLELFPAGRAVLTGNPVRQGFAEVGPPPAGGPPSLLVFGGSRGARAINRAMTAELPRLAASGARLRIRHQTGPEDEEEVRRAYRAAGVEAEVSAFIEEMPAAVAACHLALCRAGAGTVAELAVAGRPAVLVPFPQAAGGHQQRNAEVLARAGAAVVLRQEELAPGRLAGVLLELLADRPRLERMAAASRGLGRPEAAARLADLIEEMTGRGRR